MGKRAFTSLGYLEKFGTLSIPKDIDDVHWRTVMRDAIESKPYLTIDAKGLCLFGRRKTKGVEFFKFKNKELATLFVQALLDPNAILKETKHGELLFILNHLYNSSGSIIHDGSKLLIIEENETWLGQSGSGELRDLLVREIELITLKILAEVNISEDDILPSFRSLYRVAKRNAEGIDLSTSEGGTDWTDKQRIKRGLNITGSDLLFPEDFETSFIAGEKELFPIVPTDEFSAIFRIPHEKEYNLMAKVFKKAIKKKGYKISKPGQEKSMAYQSFYTKLLPFLRAGKGQSKEMKNLALAMKNLNIDFVKQHMKLGRDARRHVSNPRGDIVTSQQYYPVEEDMPVTTIKGSKVRILLTKTMFEVVNNLKKVAENNDTSTTAWDNTAHVLAFPLISVLIKTYGVVWDKKQYSHPDYDASFFEKYFEDFFFKRLNNLKRMGVLDYLRDDNAFHSRMKRILKVMGKK